MKNVTVVENEPANSLNAGIPAIYVKNIIPKDKEMPENKVEILIPFL